MRVQNLNPEEIKTYLNKQYRVCQKTFDGRVYYYEMRSYGVFRGEYGKESPHLSLVNLDKLNHTGSWYLPMEELW